MSHGSGRSAADRMTPEDWRRAGRRVRIGRHEVFVREEGEGDALLLLHGFPAGSWSWHRMWPDLARRFRVVAPDLLGFGFSDKPAAGPYTILAQADLVESLLDEIGIRRLHILAHAYGDSVAQELIARREERGLGPGILCVCFLNGGLFPEANRLLPGQRLMLTGLGRVLARLLPFPYPAFRRSFSRTFGPRTRPTEAEMREFWGLFARAGGKRVVPLTLRYLRERVDHRDRWVGALRTTEVPLRLVIGPADPISGGQAGRWRELLPERDVVMLSPGIAHQPPLEAPREVLAAFLEFVGRG
ncbi:MAG: alpha/beta fold hydrolase [Gemmatimonadota bacterium]